MVAKRRIGVVCREKRGVTAEHGNELTTRRFEWSGGAKGSGDTAKFCLNYSTFPNYALKVRKKLFFHSLYILWHLSCSSHFSLLFPLAYVGPQAFNFLLRFELRTTFARVY